MNSQDSDLFFHPSNDVTKEKNAVKGSMSNIYSVEIGDETHYHYPEQRLPKELTLSIPKTHPHDIVGRKEDLEQLHELLTTQKRVVVVNGLGGIGKTTLAQVYVCKYYDEYQHIAWITQKQGSIINDFVNPSCGLIKNLGVETTSAEAELLFEEIVRKLKGITSKPNLLIIDNGTESLKKYLDMLPSQPQWHLLVTSREEINGFHLQQLGLLNEEQAVALFKRYYAPGKLNDQNIKELVMTVGYHTLTIEILAKTADTHRYDAATLKRSIEKNLKANIEVRHNPSGSIEKVGTYLQAVFNLSRLNGNEIWMIKQFTCLPITFHTYDLLYELFFGEDEQYASTFSETLRGIVRKGWLLQNKPSDSYKMHPVIAEVVRKTQIITTEDIKRLIVLITHKLAIDQSKDNPVDKFEWIPYGQAVLAHCTGNKPRGTAILQNALALVLKALGDYHGARALLEKAVKSNEKGFGRNRRLRMIHCSNLAAVLKELGDYQGSRVLFEEVLQYNEKKFGKDHPKTAQSHSNLAVVLTELGDYQSARFLLEKAMQSDERSFGEDHPITAIRYTNLATVLQAIGDYQSAKFLLEKALRSDEKNFGEDHPTTAHSCSNLAVLLNALGDYRRAKILSERAFQFYEKNFGEDHPVTAQSCSNLALVLNDLNDYQNTKLLMEKVVRSNKRNLGEDHPVTAASYTNLATTLKELGDYQGAKLLLEKALQFYEKNFGEDHPATALGHSNLAVILSGLGDHQRAKLLLEKAVKSDERNFGVGHPVTAVKYSNLALVLNKLKDCQSARLLLEEAVRSNEKNFGEGHLVTGVSYSYLAGLLHELGDYSGAISLLVRSLQFAEKNFKDHPVTALKYSDLAMVCHKFGDERQAFDLLEMARDILIKAFPEEHPYMKVIKRNFNSILMEPISVLLATAAGYILKAVAQSKTAENVKEEILERFWKWIKPFFIKVMPKIEEKVDDPETEAQIYKRLKELIKDESFLGQLAQHVKNLMQAGIKEKNIIKGDVKGIGKIKVGDKGFFRNEIYDRKNIVEGDVRNAEEFTLGDGH